MLVLEQNQKENQIKLVNHMATFVWQTDRTDRQTASRETEDNVQVPLIVACCVFFASLWDPPWARSQLEMRCRQVIVF